MADAIRQRSRYQLSAREKTTPTGRFRSRFGKNVSCLESRYRTATVRVREKMATITELAGESACPTLLFKTLETCGAEAFGCQPTFSRTLRELGPQYKK